MSPIEEWGSFYLASGRDGVASFGGECERHGSRLTDARL